MGKLISFSGIDGAGKSTQVALLKEYLKKEGKSIYVSEEMFGYFLLKPIIGLLRSTTDSPKSGPVKRNNNFLFKLWFIPAFFDIWLNYLLNVLPKRNKYDFVIADRFFTDIWANLLYYGYAPEWAFRNLVQFLPKSDLAFIFMVNPKNVRKREDDFPLSYYQEQAEIYKDLEKLRDHQVLDANKSKETVFRKIRQSLKDLLLI